MMVIFLRNDNDDDHHMLLIIFFVAKWKKKNRDTSCVTKEGEKEAKKYECLLILVQSTTIRDRRIRGMWGEKPTRGNSLYRVVVSISIEWLTGCLCLMGDSSVYIRVFYCCSLFMYVIIIILRWQNYVHLCMHERLFWRCTIS